MKLASALADRADLQRRIDELGARLNSNAKVQEGEAPSEDPNELLMELARMTERLEDLMIRINLTNANTMLEGLPLTAYLARRDCLKKRLNLMRDFLSNARDKVNRFTRSEIVIKSTVDVAELQKEVDGLAKELRIVDEKLQEANWLTELM